MQSYVQKWGNSLGIRIPKSLAQRVGLSEGVAVEFQVDKNAIIIRPKRYNLETLLSLVTQDNLHDEVSTGEQVGREVW